MGSPAWSWYCTWATYSNLYCAFCCTVLMGLGTCCLCMRLVCVTARNHIPTFLFPTFLHPQVRNPIFVADCHPSCPTNSFGQPVVMEGTQALPWKQVGGCFECLRQKYILLTRCQGRVRLPLEAWWAAFDNRSLWRCLGLSSWPSA